MTVAVRNGCQTCVSIHGSTLGRLGRPDLVAPLRESADLPDPELEAVRVFVHRVLDQAGEVSEEELDGFLAAGYTPANVLEVVFGIGVYTMSTFANRLLRA
jgi:alkylhydroperoxidase family enzyme